MDFAKVFAVIFVIVYVKGMNEINEVEGLEPCIMLTDKIVGGKETTVTVRPYQVSFVVNRTFFCGGFVIGPQHIMTAAHCVQGASPDSIRLRAGSTFRDRDGVLLAVANVTAHAMYNNPAYDYDIAVLTLVAPVTFSESIAAVALPPANLTVPIAGVTVSGWGLTVFGGRDVPTTMMEVTVPTVPQWLCQLSYGSTVTEHMFCAGNFLIGGEDACQGDSGGPAVYEGVAYGIVSYSRGCAWPLSPTVFTNIASLRDWVQQMTGI